MGDGSGMGEYCELLLRKRPPVASPLFWVCHTVNLFLEVFSRLFEGKLGSEV